MKKNDIETISDQIQKKRFKMLEKTKNASPLSASLLKNNSNSSSRLKSRLYDVTHIKRMSIKI